MVNGASFTSPYIDGSMILVQNQDNDKPKKTAIHMMNFAQPFDPKVWYVTITTILIAAIIYPCIEYMGGELDSLWTVRKWLTGRLYLSFIKFTGNYSYEPKTLGGCVFGFTYAFWSMLMLAAYTANLASLLVVKHTVPALVINGIGDAIKYKMSICVPEGTIAEDYIDEMYPEVSNLTDMFISVPDNTRDKYGSLNNGTSRFLIDWQNSFDVVKHQQEYNPDCQLQQKGRTIKKIEWTFSTKLDPGHKCTLLINEVFNFYIKQMEDNGKLRELWQSHIASLSDPGHCDSTYNEDTLSSSSTSTDSSRRYLKGDAGSTTGSVVAANEASAYEESAEQLSLSVQEMAGTFLFQAVGTMLAILVTILSYFEKKYIHHKEKKIQRESIVMNALADGIHMTLENSDDSVDTALGQRQRIYKNRQTTDSTRDGSSFVGFGTNANVWLNDINKDDDDYSNHNSSVRLPRPPSFTSDDNNNNDLEREQECNYEQREQQQQVSFHQRLNNLLSSHDELRHELKNQNNTIISLLKNMSVTKNN